MTIADFSKGPAPGWVFVADGVMGGVSDGGAVQAGALRLSGRVSTENNGGFLQVRHRFDAPWPGAADGVELTVRGNGELYYVFLKTWQLTRPWQSYRAAFGTGPDWLTHRLPFAGFTRSHAEIADAFRHTDVRSLAFVAYGRDHEADLSVARVALYGPDAR
ncbi:MAG: CIA30 family protein [Pseudomonadota bacterium]